MCNFINNIALPRLNLITLTFLLLCTPSFYEIAFADDVVYQNAVTTNGESVVLYKDGTWVFNSSTTAKDSNDVKDRLYVLGDSNSIFLDSKSWIRINKSKDDFGGYTKKDYLSLDRKIYLFIIEEATELPLDIMPEAIKTNAINGGATSFTISNIVDTTINGFNFKIIYFETTIKNIKYKYSNACFASANGTLQIGSFTELKDWDLNAYRIEALLRTFR